MKIILPLPMFVSVRRQPRDEMKMRMKYDLSGGAAAIGTQIKRVGSDCLEDEWRDFFYDSHDGRDVLLGCFKQIFRMALRNKKTMPWIERTDVQKDENIIRLINFLRRDGTVKDFAEDAVRGHREGIKTGRH